MIRAQVVTTWATATIADETVQIAALAVAGYAFDVTDVTAQDAGRIPTDPNAVIVEVSAYDESEFERFEVDDPDAILYAERV